MKPSSQRAEEYQLAQLNIAKFRLPQSHPVNKDFVDNLDRVNAAAESQPGFVWRLLGSEYDAISDQVFGDPRIIVNLSVWKTVQSLADFTYKNKQHTAIMRRRKEWFDNIDVHMVLWWIEKGRRPSVQEAKIRLDLLRNIGPTYSAFTFKQAYAEPTGDRLDALFGEQ